MDKCEAHSGVCANIENINQTCKDHRGQFDKKLDEIKTEIKAHKAWLIATLAMVSIQLAFFILNNAPKLMAVSK
jgi:hypothetical protein